LRNMVTRALKSGLTAKYLVMDSWFTMPATIGSLVTRDWNGQKDQERQVPLSGPKFGPDGHLPLFEETTGSGKNPGQRYGGF